MARGWDSKAVEDQIGEAEAAKEARARPQLSEREVELKGRRSGLLLARARVVATLDLARDARHRVVLERSLAHIDAELREIASETGA